MPLTREQYSIHTNFVARGLAATPNGIEFQGKIIACGAFPIGIDPEKFQEGLKKEKVQKRIAMLEQKFQGVKLMVGVDRLDYIKGVPQKLHALEVFLSDHPEWVGKVVLVQVAVPSRQDVEEYQNLRAVVNELVGRINGKFGECSVPLENPDTIANESRNRGIHAYPFPPQVGQLRRTHCAICGFRCMHCFIHPGWHESGRIRVYRIAEKPPRRFGALRICRRGPES